MAELPEAKSSKPRQGRSPSYPVMPVDKAIEQARALFQKEGLYAVPLTSAFSAWGYSDKSSGGRQTLATLKYYRLIDVEGEGDTRKVRISDLARKIILDDREDQTERRALIKEASLYPNIHQVLFDKYPNGLASDSTVRHFLVFDHHFNQDAANELIAEFKLTASYAGLFGSSEKEEKTDKIVDKFSVGDYIQWEIGGQIQWRTPWMIAEIQKHSDGNKYCRVTGTGSDLGKEGWIPMDQAIAADSPNIGATSSGVLFPPPKSSEGGDSFRNIPPPKDGMREDKASLDEGEVILHWPETLSADSVTDFEYWVKGIIKRAKRRAGISDTETTQKP